MWLHSLKVAQLLRSAACLHTNQSRSYLNHLVFCFYSYVILQFVVVRVVKEYALIVVQSLIFPNHETHNTSTLCGNIFCAINGNFNLFQRFEVRQNILHHVRLHRVPELGISGTTLLLPCMLSLRGQGLFTPYIYHFVRITISGYYVTYIFFLPKAYGSP